MDADIHDDLAERFPPLPPFDAKRHMRRVYIFCATMAVLYFGAVAAIVWSVNNGHTNGMVEIVVWVGRVFIFVGLGLIFYLVRKLFKMGAIQ